MKQLTRVFAFILIVLSSLQVNAQTFAVKGGLNLAKVHFNDALEEEQGDIENLAGFHLGLTADFPINEILSFETGLLLNTKGVKSSLEEPAFGLSFESKLRAYYLDVPLAVKGSYAIGENKIFATAGPYVGIGLTGKTYLSLEIDGEGETETEDIDWGDDEDADLRRLDMGLTFGAGVEMNHFVLGIGYDLGLFNILPDIDPAYSANHRVLRFSVGYKF